MEELEDQLQNTISNELKHKHYDRVCKLALKYKAFISNEPTVKKTPEGKYKEEYPLNQYLRQFVRREDADLFEQRKNITKHYTPSICSQIMRPFSKVLRSNRAIKLIDNKDAKKVTEIEKALTHFYGESDNNGVDQFLSERFKILTFTDPNAWIWITFNKFDPNSEKPQTFPVEYSSEDVVNFSVTNDQTNWVIVKLDYDYIDKGDKPKKAERWIIFGKNDSFEYKEAPKDIKVELESDSTWTDPKTKKRFYTYRYNHKSNRVALMRVGYRKDISTNDQTFVNPFHYEAMPLLEQFIKISSELQLSITLHTFPKQVSYVSVCEAKGCNQGVLADGKTHCPSCSGTGKKVHTTAADVMEIPMPKRPEDMVDVSNISAYVPFPGNVMEFLDSYAEKMEKKIMRMVFNSESIIQTKFKTATEADIDVDSIYDTLHPFAEKYSELWMFMAKLTVLYLGYQEETIVYHKFPTDFKMKSLNQLLNELKAANDSNAPSYIRESINNDIADIIYSDDQEERAKLAIKNKHFPFPGKSDFEIQNIILNNLATRYKQVLYANFDNIFDEVEGENSSFYNMSYDKQREIIKQKVDAIIDELNNSIPKLDLT